MITSHEARIYRRRCAGLKYVLHFRRSGMLDFEWHDSVNCVSDIHCLGGHN
jgi:hypothetical protein